MKLAQRKIEDKSVHWLQSEFSNHSHIPMSSTKITYHLLQEYEENCLLSDPSPHAMIHIVH